MSILFESFKIKNMQLKNRFVRSATGDAGADINGHVTNLQLKRYAALAEGGIGFIITGVTYIHRNGRISPVQLSIDHDGCIAGLKKLTATVHKHGAKIGVQLFHAGRENYKFLKDTSIPAKGPSYVKDDPYFVGEYEAMTEDDIRETIRAYGDAAKRARAADFDAVQIHAAHGYLPSQFLSPHSNRRRDEWGGSLENRARLLLEICKDIRDKAGPDYPVLAKLGVQDGFADGLELGEGVRTAQLLARGGFDALEVSQGLRGMKYEGTEFRTKINNRDREGYFRSWCKDVKTQVHIPVMMVGGLRTFELMEEIINRNEADAVSLCRPLIRQPGIVNAWMNGDRSRPTCISCNKCLEAIINRESLRCIQDEIMRQ